MNQFQFETITADQALNLETDDVVVFASGPANAVSVTYGATANNISTVTIASPSHSVTFGIDVIGVSAHHNLQFPDGSLLLIGGVRTEQLDGGAGNDALFGGDGGDTLSGHGGANVLQGNQGDDSLSAEDGRDTIFGGQGADVITTGLGTAGEAGDFCQGNKGDDTVTGSAGADVLLGGQGNDFLLGGLGADVLNGNLGDDRIIADGAATILGEDGADTLAARAEGAVLSGGAGADLFGFALPSSDPIAGPGGTISDWAIEDSINFLNVGVGHAYDEIMAQDFASALAMANRAMADSMDPMRTGGEVVVAQVGGDLFAFVANAGSADADFAIRIVSRTLADISAADFI